MLHLLVLNKASNVTMKRKLGGGEGVACNPMYFLFTGRWAYNWGWGVGGGGGGASKRQCTVLDPTLPKERPEG